MSSSEAGFYGLKLAQVHGMMGVSQCLSEEARESMNASWPAEIITGLEQVSQVGQCGRPESN